MLKIDTVIQHAFAARASIYGVLKRGLLPVVASLFFSTSCDKLMNKEPSDPDASSANSAEEQIELERIRKEKEERGRKAKQIDAAEKERLEQELQKREQEQAKRKAEADSEERRMRIEESRSQAVGQQIARLETLKGDVYENVVIRDVTPIGIEIRHDAGSRRVPFEQLPTEMQRQFHFDPKEKEQALRREHAAQSAQMAQVTTANTENPKVQGSGQANQNEEHRLKAIAAKSARIQLLEDEIRWLENDLYNEENKKYSNGRWSHDAGGVSRAPIVREKINEKRGELSTLKQQVATLQVELDSMR